MKRWNKWNLVCSNFAQTAFNLTNCRMTEAVERVLSLEGS
jgi:hypothetical protein